MCYEGELTQAILLKSMGVESRFRYFLPDSTFGKSFYFIVLILSILVVVVIEYQNNVSDYDFYGVLGSFIFPVFSFIGLIYKYFSFQIKLSTAIDILEEKYGSAEIFVSQNLFSFLNKLCLFGLWFLIIIISLIIGFITCYITQTIKEKYKKGII
jgi:hypothetical protein